MYPHLSQKPSPAGARCCSAPLKYSHHRSRHQMWKSHSLHWRFPSEIFFFLWSTDSWLVAKEQLLEGISPFPTLSKQIKRIQLRNDFSSSQLIKYGALKKARNLEWLLCRLFHCDWMLVSSRDVNYYFASNSNYWCTGFKKNESVTKPLHEREIQWSKQHDYKFMKRSYQ